MSLRSDYPENVPSAKQGTADSVAAPGCVGVGGTNDVAWISVGDFLARQYVGIVIRGRARSEAAQALACGSAAQGQAAISAINFGGYAGAYPTSVPIGNTGTTSTGHSL